jgi:Ran GTPase-activating protein (RanGAP) involved in mRNA processing and transport
LGKGGTSLYGLNLYRNPLGPAACQTIRDLIKPSRCASITDLNLGNCSIDSEGLAAIMKFMPKNDTLLKLHLQKNTFGYDGAVIAKGVVPNRRLQYLDLSQNDFTSAGVCTMMATIDSLKHHNRKLQTLILSECDVCDIGAKSIGDMLRV